MAPVKPRLPCWCFLRFSNVENSLMRMKLPKAFLLLIPRKWQQRAKERGYRVILLYFWLPSPEMAEERVATRAASGGHSIPKDVIHRRYWAGINNLFDIFIPIVDRWLLYDNSGSMEPIVERSEIIDYPKFSKIKKLCQNRKR